MSKKSRSEGNRVAMAIKANKSDYYISDVDLEDNYEDMLSAGKNVRKTLGKVETAFMLISAGVKNLNIYVDTKNISKDWLEACLKDFTEKRDILVEEDVASISIEIDCPFKLKDVVRASAFAYLRKNNLLEEESEEEEYFEF